ncbi:MAG: two-component system NtrC family sensor kinase [Desulforhopalus sp.]|jgi:two-component system NtrC family sensor kinase
MIVFIIIIAIWMASILTKRITSIIKSIRLFQNGDLNQRIKITSGDELAELGVTFNSMADKIQQSMARIRSAHKETEITNQQLVKEVATRKQAELELAAHSDTLEEMVTVRTRELEQEVSERKQALEDLKKTQVQLLHSEKLAGIGQLAAGIAHEINTPIQYIGDNIRFFQESFQDFNTHAKYSDQLLHNSEGLQLTTFIEKMNESKEKMDLDYLREEVPLALEQTLKGVDRVAVIVKSMKNFSHPGEKDKTYENINEAIENTLTVSSNEWKYVAEIDINLDPDLPQVPCFPGELNQVLLNMVINAAQAIGDSVKLEENTKGLIRIQTRKVENDVEISISDSGPGIPKEVQDKIFDPFFTTKVVGKGTGQGLAISWSVIVDKHGGKIWFDTNKTGTTFFISLPISEMTTES